LESKLPALALVTGAGHRIGRAIAMRLAALGYAVGIHYFSSEPMASETASDIQAQGGTAFTWQADLRKMEDISGLFMDVQDTGLPLQVLVNSAAIMKAGSLMDAPLADWDDTLNLNLRAAWLCARESARLMDAGVIINITDAGIGQTWTRYPIYQLSKEGLSVLTRQFARALAPSIRVNAIAPGLILPPEGDGVEAWQHLVDRIPLQRPGSPEDIAEAVEYLIRSDYMTGATITLDGGNHLI